MTEMELKVEIFDILEKQDNLQLAFTETTKLKDEKVKEIANARKVEDKDKEKSLKLEVFDLLEKLDQLKFTYSEFDKVKGEKYTELTKLRQKKE